MLHYTPQHVSSNTLLIIRRTNCITTASGIVTLCKQPYSMRVESGLMHGQKNIKLWVNLVQDRDEWRDVVYMVMNVQAS